MRALNRMNHFLNAGLTAGCPHMLREEARQRRGKFLFGPVSDGGLCGQVLQARDGS